MRIYIYIHTSHVYVSAAEKNNKSDVIIVVSATAAADRFSGRVAVSRPSYPSPTTVHRPAHSHYYTTSYPASPAADDSVVAFLYTHNTHTRFILRMCIHRRVELATSHICYNVRAAIIYSTRLHHNMWSSSDDAHRQDRETEILTYYTFIIIILVARTGETHTEIMVNR